MTETSYTITALGMADLEALRAISAQTFTETFAAHNTPEDMQRYIADNLSLEKLGTELNTEGTSFYFARCEGKPAAYLKLNSGKAQTVAGKPGSLEIERIYVLQAFQGMKLGKILLQKTIDEAKQRGLSPVWLGVWEHNQKALAFYEHHGFVRTGSHVFMLGSDAQTDYIMELALPQERHAR